MNKICFIPIVILLMILLESFVSSGDLTTMDGRLTYEKGNGIFLITNETKRINLSFVYDSENSLVIDDFGYVEVTGRYYKHLNVLRVEAINGTTELPFMCYIE